PGHETWLIPARKNISPLLTGEHKTLAVRVSDHPLVKKLCQQFAGAITSTSANKNGLAESRNLFTARRYFNNQIDYYLPGMISGSNKPSRIRDGISGKIIRK
ncbi:MAG: tRNA threonylcarbamoyladenosine biosynthesis protein RimN, partial [Gammaproteobacteria bacterium]